IRSLEIDAYGLESRIFKRPKGREDAGGRNDVSEADLKLVRERLRVPNWERVFYIADAFRLGMNPQEIEALTAIDPWFLSNIKEIVEFEDRLTGTGLRRAGSSLLRLLTAPAMREAKALGFS